MMGAVEYFLTVWILAITRSSDDMRAFFSGSTLEAPTRLGCCKPHDFFNLSDTSVIATLISEDELPESTCIEFLREVFNSGKGKGWFDAVFQGYTSSQIEEDPAATVILALFLLSPSACNMVSGETDGRSVAESQGQTSSFRFSAPPPPYLSGTFVTSSISAAPEGSLKHNVMRDVYRLHTLYFTLYLS
jgi:hypothetical protein